MAEIILKGRGISKSFDGIRVLENIDIDIPKGSFTVIMGSSGAGKSTLLYALSGMDKPDLGQIEYKGKSITELSERQMSKLRSEEFGFIFQQIHLVSSLTLFENVTVAGCARKADTADVIKRTEKLFEKMNLLGVKDKLPSEVSGGEGQRAAVARAVIKNPGIVFADEPTGALNRSNTDGVLDLLSGIHNEGQTVLMVTHDMHCALRGDRIIYLDDGHIKGELSLGGFVPGDIQRQQRLSDWLAAQGW